MAGVAPGLSSSDLDGRSSATALEKAPHRGDDCDSRARPAISVGILGSLRVEIDGVEVLARAETQRLVLNVLAAEAGSPIRTEELLDVLEWQHPDRHWRAGAVHTSMWRLHHLLPGAILSDGASYTLDPLACEVDTVEFERLVQAARTALVGGQSGNAADILAVALRLWRGRALSDWRDHPRAAPIAARLDALHGGAAVEHGATLVASDRLVEAVEVGRELVVRYPDSERAWASLVTALGRLDQVDEARRTLDDARRALAQVGLEPGIDLQAMAGQLASRPESGEAPAGGPRHRDPLVRLARERPLVGRDDELGVIDSWIRAALGGGGARLITVSGSAGVGKTRLVAEAAARAEDAGANVWFEICEPRLTSPYGPLLNLIRRLLRQAGPERRKVLEEGPLRVVGGHAWPRDRPTERERWLIFESVAELLAERSAGGGVIVIDDLHTAPEDTFDLLHHLLLARPESRLAVIGTVRRGMPASDPGSHGLARLRRLPMSRHLELLPLNPFTAVELLYALDGPGPDPDEELLDRVEILTGGNPLLITALSRDRQLVEDLQRSGHSRQLVLSSSTDGLVAACTDGLEPAELAVIQAAALVGRTFDSRVLRAAGSRSKDFSPLTVDEVLGRAVRVGWMRQDPEAPYLYTFVHELVQRAISGETPPTLAARLRWAVGGGPGLDGPGPAGPGPDRPDVAGELLKRAQAVAQRMGWDNLLARAVRRYVAASGSLATAAGPHGGDAAAAAAGRLHRLPKWDQRRPGRSGRR